MASSPVRPIAVMVAALLPTGLLAWYQSGPARDQPIDVRLEHFVITSNRFRRRGVKGKANAIEVFTLS
jgi:hypothetical protein